MAMFQIKMSKFLVSGTQNLPRHSVLTFACDELAQITAAVSSRSTIAKRIRGACVGTHDGKQPGRQSSFRGRCSVLLLEQLDRIITGVTVEFLLSVHARVRVGVKDVTVGNDSGIALLS